MLNAIYNDYKCPKWRVTTNERRSESGIRKWEEMWFKTTAEDGERGGSSDVRWKTVPQTSGCNRKRSVTDSGQTSTSNVHTLMRQNVVVIWLQCLLVDVVRHTGSLASDHVDICTPKQRPYRYTVLWFILACDPPESATRFATGQ